MTLKNKASISITFVAVAIIGITSFYLYVFNNFLNISQDIANKRVLVDTETKRAHDVSVLKQQVLLARSQQEKISQFFLQKDQIAPFLGFIENIGTNNKSLVSIGSVSINKDNKTSSLNLTFKVSGTYQQVMDTLQNIEQIPYYSRVQKVILNVAPGSGGGEVNAVVGADGKTRQVKSPVTDPFWTADVTVDVFSFIDEQNDIIQNTSTPVSGGVDSSNNTTVPKSIN